MVIPFFLQMGCQGWFVQHNRMDSHSWRSDHPGLWGGDTRTQTHRKHVVSICCVSQRSCFASSSPELPKGPVLGALKSLAPSFENNHSSCSLPTSPDSDDHRKAEEWEMPHTQLSLALRDPLALDGSRPQCEPGFSGSPRLCVQNFAETLSAGRTRKKKKNCCLPWAGLTRICETRHMNTTLNQREKKEVSSQLFTDHHPCAHSCFPVSPSVKWKQ